MSAEAVTRTQGWDRGSVGLPGQDADTALLSRRRRATEIPEDPVTQACVVLVQL